MKALALLLPLALFGCGADTPVPAYPFPAPTPLEDTDLAQYIESDDMMEEEEDEEWDDGLDGVDLSMDESTTEAPAEGATE